ncbi:MAG: FeoA domain-containing protein [Candidatus Omnitrophica bacterium]|nr:FeoA domain-containing protein [Candidatus Omnitrophota bacterium]
MKKEVLPLTRVPAEKEVVLISIEAGWGLRRRLLDMGLREGQRFKILHAHRPGPSIILVGNTRLVLGHGMAHKILVKEA